MSGVVLRNLRIEGSAAWQARWNRRGKPATNAPGMPGEMSAIRLQGAPGALIENVEIEGFPQKGIFGFGLDDGIIRDVDVRHCFAGVHVAYYEPSRRLLVERVKVRDTWGPGPGHWKGIGGDASAARPGGFSGGDGIVLDSVREGVLRDCEVAGEHFASFKLVNPIDFEASQLRGAQLMVKGTADLDWKIHKQPARNVTIRDCDFDKTRGFGSLRAGGNLLQMSWHIHDLSIARCALDGAGYGGHGLELAVDVNANVVDCTFENFNGNRGNQPAYAAYVAEGCTLNPDFEQRNRFVNQTRKLLRAGA